MTVTLPNTRLRLTQATRDKAMPFTLADSESGPGAAERRLESGRRASREPELAVIGR